MPQATVVPWIRAWRWAQVPCLVRVLCALRTASAAALCCPHGVCICPGMAPLPLAALTSVAGVPLVAEEQDLTGFDSSSIQAAWQPQLAAGQEQGAPGTGKKRLAAVRRLPWRSASANGGGEACDQQPTGALSARPTAESQQEGAAAGRALQRSATLPSLQLGPPGGGPAYSGEASGAASSRRPPLLQLLHLPGATACEAETPTLFKPAKARDQQQQQEQQQPARGLPPEAWTPIDLQEVRQAGGRALPPAACLLAQATLGSAWR